MGRSQLVARKRRISLALSLSAGVKHGDLRRILFECHISIGIAEITIRMSSRFLKFMGICHNEKNWGSCQKKRCIEGTVCRRSFSSISLCGSFTDITFPTLPWLDSSSHNKGWYEFLTFERKEKKYELCAIKHKRVKVKSIVAESFIDCRLQ